MIMSVQRSAEKSETAVLITFSDRELSKVELNAFEMHMMCADLKTIGANLYQLSKLADKLEHLCEPMEDDNDKDNNTL